MKKPTKQAPIYTQRQMDRAKDAEWLAGKEAGKEELRAQLRALLDVSKTLPPDDSWL